MTSDDLSHVGMRLGARYGEVRETHQLGSNRNRRDETHAVSRNTLACPVSEATVSCVQRSEQVRAIESGEKVCDG